ncbi:unnamed protein product [Lathyrus oleraceus]|nr:organelle RRM domain-containing protein 6, chloroplastic [Pisum sativum]
MVTPTAMTNILVGVPSLSLPSFHLPNSNIFTLNSKIKTLNHKLHLNFSQTNHTTTLFPSSLSSSKSLRNRTSCYVLSCLPPASESSSSNTTPSSTSTRLYVSGLSFRTTEESLRNAFKNFGQLVEVNLVMDKVANRPRGFAFLRYENAEGSNKAIEGMHGKFLDGRVIFVEVAKPRSKQRQRLNQNTM